MSSSSSSESSTLSSDCPSDDLFRFAIEFPRTDIAGVVPGVSTSTDDSRDVLIFDDLIELVGLFDSSCFLNKDRSISETFGKTTPFAIRDEDRTTISSSLSSESAMVDVTVLGWAVAIVPRDTRRGWEVVKGVFSAVCTEWCQYNRVAKWLASSFCDSARERERMGKAYSFHWQGIFGILPC